MFLPNIERPVGGKVVIRYGKRIIERAVVQCPRCQRWFGFSTIIEHEIDGQEGDINNAYCDCPACHLEFQLPEDAEEKGAKIKEFPKVSREKITWIEEDY